MQFSTNFFLYSNDWFCNVRITQRQLLPLSPFSLIPSPSFSLPPLSLLHSTRSEWGQPNLAAGTTLPADVIVEEWMAAVIGRTPARPHALTPLAEVTRSRRHLARGGSEEVTMGYFGGPPAACWTGDSFRPCLGRAFTAGGAQGLPPMPEYAYTHDSNGGHFVFFFACPLHLQSVWKEEVGLKR